MNIYQLKKPTDTYDVVELDVVTMTKQILSKTDLKFDDVVKTVMDIPKGETTLLSLSKDGFQCRHHPKAKKQNYDINLYGSFLILNKKAYNCLHKSFSSYGEFVPLDTSGEDLILFNVLTFGVEDSTLTEMGYLDGFEDGLKSLAFEADDIEKKLIFKSKLQGGFAIYCTDELRTLVTENDLSGITFNKDLLSLF
jgi:hypothetical protein